MSETEQVDPAEQESDEGETEDDAPEIDADEKAEIALDEIDGAPDDGEEEAGAATEDADEGDNTDGDETDETASQPDLPEGETWGDQYVSMLALLLGEIAEETDGETEAEEAKPRSELLAERVAYRHLAVTQADDEDELHHRADETPEENQCEDEGDDGGEYRDRRPIGNRRRRHVGGCAATATARGDVGVPAASGGAATDADEQGDESEAKPPPAVDWPEEVFGRVTGRFEGGEGVPGGHTANLTLG